MKVLLCCSCILPLLIGSTHCNGDGVGRMVKILHGLTRALHYMQERVSDLNLDGVFCVRHVQEQLQAFLTYDVLEFRTVRHWIEVLRDKAKRVADLGRLYVHQNDPSYAAGFGYWMDESLKIIWYPSRNTSEQFVDIRYQCSSPEFVKFTNLGPCFMKIGANKTNLCDVTPGCLELNSKQHQRDYVLTHQMLYWKFMESSDCIDEIPELLQLRFCSNVMRDAKLIAAANYPHKDLFMEQIGLCGFWGFRDFYKPDWIERILYWQHDSGCFADYAPYKCTDNLQPDPPARVKRSEVTFPDKCLSHKTGVALLAMAANLRFEAEKTFQEMDKSQNALNKLLT